MLAVLDSLDNLSEEMKKEYKAGEGGKFYLIVTPVTVGKAQWAFEDVAGLRTGLQSERTAREEAEKKLKPFEGLDATAAREAVAKVTEMSNWTPEQKVQERIATEKTNLERGHKKALDEAFADRDLVLTHFSKSAIQDAGTRALAAHKGSIPLLLPIVQSKSRLRRTDNKDIPFVVEVLDDNGQARISPKPGSTAMMSIEELVEEMKGSDTYARAFDGTGAQGGGASGGSSGSSNGNGGGGGGGGGGTYTVSRRDTEAMKRAFDDIGTGKARVVD